MNAEQYRKRVLELLNLDTKAKAAPRVDYDRVLDLLDAEPKADYPCVESRNGKTVHVCSHGHEYEMWSAAVMCDMVKDPRFLSDQ